MEESSQRLARQWPTRPLLTSLPWPPNLCAGEAAPRAHTHTLLLYIASSPRFHHSATTHKTTCFDGSRAGLKLEGALDHFGLDVSGMRVLDAGLSTGGFTDCLLQRGASHVIGVDVGYGQVSESCPLAPCFSARSHHRLQLPRCSVLHIQFK